MNPWDFVDFTICSYHFPRPTFFSHRRSNPTSGWDMAEQINTHVGIAIGKIRLLSGRDPGLERMTLALLHLLQRGGRCSCGDHWRPHNGSLHSRCTPTLGGKRRAGRHAPRTRSGMCCVCVFFGGWGGGGGGGCGVAAGLRMWWPTPSNSEPELGCFPRYGATWPQYIGGGYPARLREAWYGGGGGGGRVCPSPRHRHHN